MPSNEVKARCIFLLVISPIFGPDWFKARLFWVDPDGLVAFSLSKFEATFSSTQFA